MTNEELILERLGRIEEDLAEITRARRSLEDLKKDLEPLTKQAFYIMLREMGSIESGFQLDDVFLLLKRFLRNIKNIAYALDQLENLMDLWSTAEPMLKSAVNHAIRYLGTLEQKGVFRTYEAMLDVRGKVAQQYGPEDIQAMGDSFVELLGLLKKLSTPEHFQLLAKLAELPGEIDLSRAEPAGPLALLSAMRDPKFRQGLGVALEMTRALGKLRQP